jgi:hypothetical protein
MFGITGKGNGTKMILHETGYLLTITSWENDGDHRTTKEVHYTDVTMLHGAVAFCELFTNSYRDTGFVGNVYDPNANELKVIQDIFCEFHLNNKEFLGEDSIDETLISDWCIDAAYDFGLTGTDFHTRMCDSIKVVYFPQDVQCDDVTADFV